MPGTNRTWDQMLASMGKQRTLHYNIFRLRVVLLAQW